MAITEHTNPTIEASLLGGCLNKPDALEWLELDPDVFFDIRHQAIWQAMQAVRAKNQQVDEYTVAAELKRVGKLEPMGGESRLVQLSLSVPTSGAMESYAEVLRELWVTRRVLLFGGSIATRASSRQGEELLSDVQQALSEIRPEMGDKPKTAGDAAVEELQATFDDMDHDKHPGVHTGIGPLDRATGGIPIGIPSLLGARPGIGKSTLVRCIAKHCAEQGVGVHVLSWEDRRNTWAQRDLADAAGVDVSRIRARTLSRDERARLTAAIDGLSKRQSVLIDHAHGLRVDQAIRRVRAMRRKLNTQLVVVDYLQLIPYPQRGLKKNEAIGENMRQLGELAGRDNLALLVLSQLDRSVAKENRAPRMEDLKESGEIEQVAKFIMALWEPDSGLQLLVIKNHQGPGQVKVELEFDKPYSRIRERPIAPPPPVDDDWDQEAML